VPRQARGSYLRDAPFVREERYSLITVPNVNQQVKKAVVIVFPGQASSVSVPSWKRAGSVSVFPAGNANAGQRTRFSRMVSVAKAVFLWLRTGDVKRRSAPESLPARHAGQPVHAETRTVSH
jgi:hypothetical protein